MKFGYKKLVSVAMILTFILLVSFFLFRNTLLQWALDKKISAYSSKFNTQIQVSSAVFKGVNGLLLTGIVVAPAENDTLLYVDSILFNLRIIPLLRGKIRFSNLEIANSNIQLIRNERKNNFSFLLKKSKEAKVDTSVKSTNYSILAEQLLNTVFDAIPSSVTFKNSKVKLTLDSLHLAATIPLFEVKNGAFSTQVNFVENDKSTTWNALGRIESTERRGEIKLFPAMNDWTEIPFLKQKWNLSLAFDTIEMQLSEVFTQKNELQLKGKFAAQNLQLLHWRISPNKIAVEKQTIAFSLHVGENFIALDSSSVIAYNKVNYHPYIRFQLYPTQQFQLEVRMAECNAQDFFDSFPEGLFENIEGLKTSGSLSYYLHFFIDTQHPDALQFSSELKRHTFKIESFGKSALTKINGNFHYTAYEKGNAVRTFVVGSSNPNFTPLNEISSYLKTALLTSEDGNFYSHRGFNEDAFRKSIATNFKEKRFVRGGSTISMQLVKNVFLTRNKTIARKMEEALLVWLIENNNLSSKDRMYEVYLNLIEWGPNVYGIREASKFYFDKTPANLSLSESIFLAMIVPRPKAFKYQFGEDGNLKESAAGYYSLVSAHMLKKGVLNEDEKNTLIPKVTLTGIAKKYVLVSDTGTVRALETDEDFE